MRRIYLGLVIIFISCFTTAHSFEFLEKQRAPDVHPRWKVHDPKSTQFISHELWQQFLMRYVQSIGKHQTAVNYADVTKIDKQKLDEYINYLSGINIQKYNRTEQLAYWINAYNALTIQLILKHYPIKSIKRIEGKGILTNNPWKLNVVTVLGITLSLDTIEHDIIRGIWKDPRIHYALNCASKSCPQLLKEAYIAQDLDKQLQTAAINFVNGPYGVDRRTENVKVSRIYLWYMDDFGGNQKSLLKHITHYSGPKLRKSIQQRRSFGFMEYDWRLNER